MCTCFGRGREGFDPLSCSLCSTWVAALRAAPVDERHSSKAFLSLKVWTRTRKAVAKRLGIVLTWADPLLEVELGFGRSRHPSADDPATFEEEPVLHPAPSTLSSPRSLGRTSIAASAPQPPPPPVTDLEEQDRRRSSSPFASPSPRRDRRRGCSARKCRRSPSVSPDERSSRPRHRRRHRRTSPSSSSDDSPAPARRRSPPKDKAQGNHEAVLSQLERLGNLLTPIVSYISTGVPTPHQLQFPPAPSAPARSERADPIAQAPPSAPPHRNLPPSRQCKRETRTNGRTRNTWSQRRETLRHNLLHQGRAFCPSTGSRSWSHGTRATSPAD